MSDQPRWKAPSDEARRAAKETGALEARLGERRGTPFRPGDLFVHPVTAEHGVEWLVLEQGTDDELIVVPADTYPPFGTADVEVSAAEPGGPLTLRCGHEVHLASAALAAAGRSGEVGSESLRRAREKLRQTTAGSLAGDPLEREVNADPEYRDWLAEVVAPARESLAALARRGTGRSEASPPQPRWSRSAWAVAASLAAALLGLSLWSVSQSRQAQGLLETNLDLEQRVQDLAESNLGLRHQIDSWADRTDRPYLLGGYDEVALGERTRSGGGSPITVPIGGGGMLLVILLGEEIPAREAYRVEISAPELEAPWLSPAVGGRPTGELLVILPASVIEGERLRLRLFGEGKDELEPLWATTLELQRNPRP